MRNMKKFLALALAMMMILSMAVVSVSAADEADYSYAANHLAAINVLKGDETGDLMLDKSVERYQAALFFAQALTAKTEAAYWNDTKTSANFTDVKEYGTAIDYAASLNVVKGRGNGIFGANDPITYQDMMVMAVRALGYETEDMVYPYGHLLAAQKLELTDNLDTELFTAPMTRGQTAQLIWNMLMTEPAIIDPLTDEVLYPGDTGLSGAINDELNERLADRDILFVEAGFASEDLDVTVTEFIPADEEDEDSVDMIVLDYEDEIPAAALGITAETPKTTYLGLDYTIFVSYVDQDAQDDGFDARAYEDGDVEIVIYEAPEFTTVKNFGDGAIKTVYGEDDNGAYVASKTYLALDGVKYADSKYVFNFMTWDEEYGWVYEGFDLSVENLPFYDDYLYNTKKADYVNAIAIANDIQGTYGDTYGEVQFNIGDTYAKEIYDYVQTEGENTPNDDSDDEFEWVLAPYAGKTIVNVLYTPYWFGQYHARDLKYTPDSETYTFHTMANYTDTAVKNLDGEYSHFQEFIFKEDGRVYGIDATTKNISRYNGELAKDTTLTGEAVENGDFAFFTFNEMDNVLNIAKNVGSFETGKLTAQNPTKKTVTIDGTKYEFGFDGVLNVPEGMNTLYRDVKTDYIEALQAGLDNAKYLAVNGKIVYMEPCSEKSDTNLGYVILSVDAERVMKVLGINQNKFDAGKTEVNGAELYIDDTGYVAVAVMDLENGGWKLGHIDAVEVDNYVWDDDEEEMIFKAKFDNNDAAGSADLATLIWRAGVADDYNGKALLEAAAGYLAADVIFPVVEEKDGVYTIAAMAGGIDAFTYTVDDEENVIDPDASVSGAVEYFLVDRAPELQNVTFADTNAMTNKLYASQYNDAADNKARVTLEDGAVVVWVETATATTAATAQFRTGAMKAKYSITDTTVFTATPNLIVMVGGNKAAELGTANWGKDSVTVTLDGYYATLADYDVEYTVNDDNSFVVTINNVLDLTTLEILTNVTYTGEDYEDCQEEIEELLTLADADARAGEVLHLDDNGVLAISGMTVGEALLEIFDDNDYVGGLDIASFEDAYNMTFGDLTDTIFEDLGWNDDTVFDAINVKVITLDNTGLIAADYDYDNMVANVEFGDLADDFDAIGDVYLNGEDDVDGVVYYYAIDTTTVIEIDTPEAGVLDNFVLAVLGEEILVPEKGEDDYTSYAESIDVALENIAVYDDNTNELTVYVIKTLTEYVAP